MLGGAGRRRSPQNYISPTIAKLLSYSDRPPVAAQFAHRIYSHRSTLSGVCITYVMATDRRAASSERVIFAQHSGAFYLPIYVYILQTCSACFAISSWPGTSISRGERLGLDSHNPRELSTLFPKGNKVFKGPLGILRYCVFTVK